MLWLARLAVRRPAPCLVLSAVLVAVFAGGLTRLELLTAGRALYPPHNRVVEQTAADRAVFHDSPPVIVLVSPRSGGAPLDSRRGLGFLAELDRSVRSVPGVRRDGVLSLASLIDVRFESGAIRVARLFERLHEDDEELRDLIQRLRARSLSHGLLLSIDSRAAVVYVPLTAGADVERSIAELERWAAAHRSGAYDVRLTGPLVAEATLGAVILGDLATLVPVMALVMAVLLFMTLRSVGAVLIPLIEVGLVLVTTFGAMGFAGVPLTLVTTLLPVLLTAMATTDEIHLLERLDCHLPERADSPTLRRALLEALAEVERPIVLTSVTTACGFLSFLATSIAPLRHFGAFAAAGILLAMLFTFTAVPALITTLPVAWLRSARARRIPSARSRPAARPSRVGVAIGCAAVLGALPGLARLDVADTWIGNFDPDSDLVQAEQELNAAFWGSHRFDVVLEGAPGLFHTREGAELVEQVEGSVRSAREVSGALSYLTVLRDLSAGQKDAPTPSTERGLRDLVTVASMGDDPFALLQWLSPDGSLARVQCYLKGADYARDRALLTRLDRELAALLEGLPARHHLSGDVAIGQEMIATIVGGQLRSLVFALVGIGAVLMLWHRGSPSALILLVPAVGGSAVVFGLMGYCGVLLGIATSMFGSLCLGVGVDFGVHFAHSYQRHRTQRASPEVALERARIQSGRAIGCNALVLSLGFLVLAASGLRPTRSLGVLLAIGIATCYAMTFLVLPRLVEATVRGRSR